MCCREWEEFLKNVKKLDKNIYEPKKEKISSVFLKEKSFVNHFTPIQKREKKEHLSVRRYSLKDIPFFQGRSLDLHGFTIEQSEYMVVSFLNRNKNWVKIITGKGKTLHHWLMSWMNHHPEFVVGWSFVEKNKGGEGAFYIHIRKNNSV